jgi:hypothetical protein
VKIRRHSLIFGGINTPCGQHPFETLKHFFPCLEASTQAAAAGWPRGRPLPTTATEQRRPAQGRRRSPAVPLFLPVSVAPKQREHQRDARPWRPGGR